MKFEKFDISEEIKLNLEKMGFFSTTDIQFKSIPAIMNGEDVLAIAQTGTGKTAAFAIPIINNIHLLKSNKKSYGIKCLVLVPTRELAKQIGHVFSKLTKNTRASSFAIYGGIEQTPQVEQLDGGVDILIATPGRMFDLIYQEFIDISKVKTLVLDEADHMLDLGFIEDIKSIKRKLKFRHQTLFFSATINPSIKKLAYSQINSSALRIQISPEKMVSKNVTTFLVKVPMDNKRHLLFNFITANPKSKILVFTRTQVRTKRVQTYLQKKSVSAQSFHGGMNQEEREQNLELFQKNDSGVMITTDVSARGIDLPKVTHVINYDVPESPENYIHRIGRTGRAFDKGEAITFCSLEETEKLKVIEAFLKKEIQEIAVSDLDQSEFIPQDIEDMDISEMLKMEEDLHHQKLQPRRKKKHHSKYRK